MQLLKWFRTVGALLLGVTLTVALAGNVTAAPTPQTSQPKAELSAESCAPGLSEEQLDALVAHMLRDEQTPSATSCYWALSETNKARVGEALLLAKGMPREQLERERQQNAGPPRATPRFRPSGQATIQASFFALHAPWGSNTGTGTLARTYYQNNGCDSDSGDNDWEYEFLVNVSAGEEGRLRYYNTNWIVDAGLRSSYPNGILTFGYHDWGVTWACMGDTAWWLGLDAVRNSLHLYKQ